MSSSHEFASTPHSHCSNLIHFPVGLNNSELVQQIEADRQAQLEAIRAKRQEIKYAKSYRLKLSPEIRAFLDLNPPNFENLTTKQIIERYDEICDQVYKDYIPLLVNSPLIEVIKPKGRYIPLLYQAMQEGFTIVKITTKSAKTKGLLLAEFYKYGQMMSLPAEKSIIIDRKYIQDKHPHSYIYPANNIMAHHNYCDL